MLGQSQPQKKGYLAPKNGYLGQGHVLQQWSSEGITECSEKLGIIVPCLVGSTAAAPGI